MASGAAKGATQDIVGGALLTLYREQAEFACPVDIGGKSKLSARAPSKALKVELNPLERK